MSEVKLQIFEATTHKEVQDQNNAFMQQQGREGKGSQTNVTWIPQHNQMIYTLWTWYTDPKPTNFQTAKTLINTTATIPQHMMPKQ